MNSWIRAPLAFVLLAALAAEPASQRAAPSAAPDSAGSRATLGENEPLLHGGVKIDRQALGGLDLVDPADRFGFASATVGDLDADGIPEVAVGSPSHDAFDNGAVRILFLDSEGRVRRAVLLTTPAPGASGNSFGLSIAALGDMDGDGIGDLAVGEPGIGAGGLGGAYWILFLRADGSVRESRLTRATSFPGAVGPLEGFSEALGALGDLDGDGIGDLAVGSPNGDFGSQSYGHLWIAFLRADGTTRAATKIGFGTGGLDAPLVARGQFGRALAGVGDLDGDGVRDLAVGAPGNEEDGFRIGRLFLLFLAPDGTVKSHRDVSEVAGGRFGSALLALGDHDADGVPDLAVSAQRSNLVRLLHLNADGSVKDQREIGAALGGFSGALDPDDRFGSSLAALAGFGGDGALDLWVGAQFDETVGTRAGAGWVLDLDAGGVVLGQAKIANEGAGPIASSRFGAALAELGDLDGDGTPELVMASPNEEGPGLGVRGAVFVLFPDADGAVKSFQKIDEVNGGYVGTLGFTNTFGASVAPLGDLDRDGLPDLAVGITRSGFNGLGRVAVLFLNADGTVRAQQEITQGQAGFGGPLQQRDLFGVSLANLGDLDGDGVIDLAVGATGDPSRNIPPALWILFLRTDGSVRDARRIAAGENGGPPDLALASGFGHALASLGDFDADGARDLAVGVLTDGTGGGVWLLRLSASGTATSVRRINATSGGFTGRVDGGFGRALAALGDLDGDGVGELAVGAPFTDPASGSSHFLGAVWLLRLRADGTVASHARIDATTAPFLGLQHNSTCGLGLAALGDRNRDGVRDLFVGVPGGGPSTQGVGEGWVLGLRGIATLDFETRGDLITPLADGEALGAAFARAFELESSGANLGPAVFDSTPDGPNATGPDPDLLVGRGKVLLLQDSLLPTQSIPGVFDQPGDDADGGTLRFRFREPVELLDVALIDIDPASRGAKVTLVDAARRARVYLIPAGWTEDLLQDGPPAVRTLDLTSLDPQPGFRGATAIHEVPGFEPLRVVTLEVVLGRSGALDLLRWDPDPRLSGGRVVPGAR